MRPRWTGFLSLSLLSIASIASAQISLEHLATVNLSSTASSTGTSFIGNNPSGVAWDGVHAWVGGYNASGSAANTALLKISDVLTNPTLGSPFGAFNTNNLRGVTGVAVQGNTLAVALDNGGGSGSSVRAFDASTGAALWSIGAVDSSRRGNGVAFDPGFNGGAGGQGVAYLSIGSGRRHLLNAATGAYLFGQNAGMIINLNPTSTTWRDLTFDPDTGDLYARESNRVTKIVRTGDNAAAGPSVALGGLTTAGTVDNQHLTFVNSTQFGDFLLFNDRATASSGQAFSSVVKAMDTTGAALTLNFGAFSALNGNGAYDFDFDPVTQTFVVLDFTNRQLYVFGFPAAVPEPGGVAFLVSGLLVGAGFLRRRRA